MFTSGLTTPSPPDNPHTRTLQCLWNHWSTVTTFNTLLALPGPSFHHTALSVLPGDKVSVLVPVRVLDVDSDGVRVSDRDVVPLKDRLRARLRLYEFDTVPINDAVWDGEVLWDMLTETEDWVVDSEGGNERVSLVLMEHEALVEAVPVLVPLWLCVPSGVGVLVGLAVSVRVRGVGVGVPEQVGVLEIVKNCELLADCDGVRVKERVSGTDAESVQLLLTEAERVDVQEAVGVEI